MFYQVTFTSVSCWVSDSFRFQMVSPVHFDYSLFLCLPGSHSYLSCLPISHSAFYCTNCNNTTSCTVHISHSKVQSRSGLLSPLAPTIFLPPFLQRSRAVGAGVL